ncbi:RHS repeat domain-containing protein [Chitinophaga qingshengii]|uniref:RHS repeat protein n=1 Tax=Chitinophaga qingshengii TaxID=1569794 RepID=A0ABR7TJ27_9BACT|nr:RHS repeat domain-containing protein [Chitinophaga qingshengii]MBC9930503.1 RHS repeat protein [Chitinophaga qingshengii]
MRPLPLFSFRHLFYCLTFIFFLSASGQDQNGNSPYNIIPPSPAAAAIDKFALVPVGYYTGVPNISIPIFNYSIPRLNYNMGIDLSYHSGGIKVDEMPSNVGIGWALNAGGSINRAVVGLPDDYPVVGFMYAPPFDQTQQKLEKYTAGQEDGEPDIFTYNFNGISGKFYVGKRTNSVNQIIQANRSGIRIEFLPDGTSPDNGAIQGFMITNTDGVKYVFDAKETAYTFYTHLRQVNYTSTWHLSKVILPVPNLTIQYEYQGYDFNYVAGKSETRDYLLSQPRTDVKLPPDETFNTSSSIVSIFAKRISRIILPGNRDIRFVYGLNRTDLPGDSQLDSIIYDTRNNRGIKLNYDYSVGHRLTLSGAQEFAGNQRKPAYVFAYNPNLPERLSFSQDHWGYYNAKLNVTLVPKLEDFEKSAFLGSRSGVPPFNALRSGDRSPDSVAALAGLLNQITYPTGGTINFEYESNRISDTIMRRYFRSKPMYTFLNGMEATQSRVFTLYNNKKIQSLNFDFTFSDYPYGIETRFTFTFAIKSLDDSKTYATSMFDYSATHGKTVVRNNLLEMPAGDYKITWTTNYPGQLDDPFSFALRWNEIVPDSLIATSFVTGGCRIKKIDLRDGITNIVQSRSFKYVGEDGILSSGVAGNIPGYSRTYRVARLITVIDGDKTWVVPTEATYLSRSSYPNQTMLYTSGSPVGYKRVEEILPSGKNVYKYTTFADVETGSFVETQFPYPPTYPRDWALGLLKKGETYDTNGKLVKKSINYYQTFSTGSDVGTLDAVKAGQSEFAYTDDMRLPGDEKFLYFEYPTPMGCSLQDSTIQTLYTTTGDSIVTRTHYTYEPMFNWKHYQPLAIAEENSTGWKKTYLTYATDYAAGTAFIDSMVRRNIITAPIEKVEMHDNQVTSGSVTHYNPSYPGMPAQTYRLETNQGIPYNGFKFSNQLPGTLPDDNKAAFSKDARYQLENIITTGDNAGTIKSVQKNHDVPVSYLWGYQQQFPVARITGATYEQAVALVDLNILNNPSNDQQLRNELNKIRLGLNNSAIVNTYTYDPLIGVTSETDASGKTVFYEYDAFGRLRLVKDLQGKIVKQFDYQYQVPPTQ